MTLRLPRHLRTLVAGLLGLTLAASLAPAASAGTPLVAFASVDSTADGCRSTVITTISGSAGVRYYQDGHRLHLPSKALRFDDVGVVELTAKAPHGSSLDLYRYRLLAPAACFDALTVDDTIPRYVPKVSWCTTDRHPFVAQAFVTDDDVAGVYVLRRRSDRHLVDYGQAKIAEGTGEARFPLDRGIPAGRYVLEADKYFQGTDGYYEWSMPVEALRCLKAPKVKTGKVTFTVPSHGPDALISISVRSDLDPVKVVRVRDGHSYTFRTSEPEITWLATPVGDHLGELGHGSLTVPAR